MKRLNYVWRLFATGLSFAVFGLGGLLLRVLVFPVLNLLPVSQERKQQQAQYCVHISFYLFIELMHTLGIMSYEVHGLDKLNKPGQLIIANHPTLIDIVFLISRIPQATCIVKDALLHNPFTRGPILGAGYISNGDSANMISDCVSCLAMGGCLIIFPEGTRTTPDMPLKFQKGAARIALKSEAVITPVTISCHPSTLTKQERWYQIPDQPFHLAMRVGNDMVLDDFLVIQPETIAVRRFNKYLVEYFVKKEAN